MQTFLKNNFPLKNNLDSLYTSVMKSAGKSYFGDICISQDRLVKVTNPDKTQIENNTNALNNFSRKQNTPLYALIAPTSAGIYLTDSLRENDENSQKNIISNIYLNLDESIAAIDAFGALYASKEDYIYYNTDESWSSLGAYKAYLVTAKKFGLEPQTMINYDLEYADNNFKGNLYSQLPYNKIPADKINLFRSKYETTVDSVELSDGKNVVKANSVYFREALKTKKKTDIYLQGNNYEKIVINTKTKDAPQLLILKGSYANMLAIMLAPHYSKITLIAVNQLSSKGQKLKDMVNLSDYDKILTAIDINEFAQKGIFDCLE